MIIPAIYYFFKVYHVSIKKSTCTILDYLVQIKKTHCDYSKKCNSVCESYWIFSALLQDFVESTYKRKSKFASLLFDLYHLFSKK